MDDDERLEIEFTPMRVIARGMHIFPMTGFCALVAHPTWRSAGV
jgi:hypothetical protein